MPKTLRYVGYAVGVWVIVTTSIAALSVPWTWNLNQVLLSSLALTTTISLTAWAIVWFRFGTAGLKSRWQARQQNWKSPSKRFYVSVAFWIVVAVGLVIFFNYYPPR